MQVQAEMVKTRSTALMLTVGSVACAACSGGPALPGLATGSLAPDFAKLTTAVSAGELSQLPHSSAEIYSRIARGANRCWFGGQGRIAKTHIMHADADPPSSGGKVEIVIHERAVDQPKPWGYKAFRVLLTESSGMGTATGGTTSIEVENAKFPDAEAQRMRAEVFHWVKGEEGCKADPALDRPVETTAAPPAAAPVKQAKGKARPKATAAAGPAAAPTKQ